MADHRLSTHPELLATAIDQAEPVVIVTDSEGTVTYANGAVTRLLGVTSKKLIGQSAAAVLVERFRAVPSPELDALRTGEEWEGPLTVLRPDWSTALLDVASTPVRDAHGTRIGHVVVAFDRTLQRLVSAELERETRDRAAVVGSLSRLRHRSSPEETASDLCAEVVSHEGFDVAALVGLWSGRAIPLAVHPHQAGLARGAPLRAGVARYLRRRAAVGAWLEPCTTSSRYGAAFAAAGMKSVATVPIIGPTEATGVLAVGSVSEDVDAFSHHLPALLEFGAMAGALLGRTLHERQSAVEGQRRLWDVIAHRRFVPVFQPIVSLASRDIVGYEALTRFHDGADPAERFRLARNFGQEVALESACLREALRAAADLPESAWVAVNVSPEFLQSGARLRRILSQTERQIVLEVTETGDVADPAGLRNRIVQLGDQIRDLRVAIDDAGSGFNGLQTILDLAPDFIKLDRSLIKGIHGDAVRQALVVGLLYFARSMQARIVAEGIETDAEAEVLRRLGVGLGQGFLFGAPESIPLDSDPGKRPRLRRPLNSLGGG